MNLASNSGLFDPYSIGHRALGVMARGIGLTLGTTMLAHTVFEIAENYYLKQRLSHLFPDASPDSPLNILGDFLSTAAGWYINDRSSAKKVNLRWSNIIKTK